MRNIFISSTFRDMQAERDLLQEEVLPQLKNRAKKYGENINLIDLRWGVDTSELESEEGSMKIISVCLDEVERSKPYMLVFMGERYGCIIDPVITQKVMARKNNDFMLEDYAISITAMEVEFGALAERCGNLENCVVCMRRFDTEKITGETERAVYRVENAELAAKQEDFKEKIINKLQGRVIEYTCDWDEQKKKLVDFRTLDGGKLSDKLVSTYESMFHEEWEYFSSLSWEEKEQLAVESVMESKLKAFNGREQLMCEYYGKALHGDMPLILQGKVGSGKTSIMCKLMQMLEETGNEVFRFVSGNTTMSETAMQLVQQMVYYLENVLGTEHLSEQLRDMRAESDEESIHGKKGKRINYSDWVERLEELAVQLGDKKVYFVIDALDQMYQDEHVKQLDFVLSSENMRYVLSCTDDFEIPDTYGSGKFMVEQIPLLSEQDAIDVVEGILTAAHRNVYRDILHEILSKKSANNPLYISMLIQRLNMMGFEELYSAWTEKDIIHHGCEVIRAMPDGEEAAAVFIIEEAIKRLDMIPNALKNVVNLIGVSRGGLRETDILAIAKEMDTPVSQLDISRLIHYLDTFFIIHQDGRIDLTHKVIRKGIRESIENMGYIAAIASRVKMLDTEDTFWKSEGMYYARMTGDARLAEQILVYAYSYEDGIVKDAIKTEGLADEGAFYCEKMELMPEAVEFFCFSWMNLFELTKEEIAIKEKVCGAFLTVCRERYEKSETVQSLEALSNAYEKMGKALLERGEAEEAIPYYEEALYALEKLNEQSGTERSLRNLSIGYDNMGNVLENLKKVNEAESYYLKALDIKEELHERNKTCQSMRDLSVSYENMGDILMLQKRTEEAKDYYEKELWLSKAVYFKSKDYDGRVDSTVFDDMIRDMQVRSEETEKIQKLIAAFRYQRRDFLESIRDLAISYEKMGRVLEEMEEFEAAYSNYGKQLHAYEDLYGENPSIKSLNDLSMSHNNMGTILMKLGKLEDAKRHYEEALCIKSEIHEKSQTTQSLKGLFVTYYKQGRFLEIHGNAQEAKEYYEKARHIGDELYGEVPPKLELEELLQCYHGIHRLLELHNMGIDDEFFYEKYGRYMREKQLKKN